MSELVFLVGHRGLRYAFPALAVREVVWRPELSPAHELPDFVVGVMNLRGSVLPVIDLGIRFGVGAERPRTQDRIVVLDAPTGEARLGVVVHEVFDVVTVGADAFVDAKEYRITGGHARFVSGQLKLDDVLVMRLDVAALVHATPEPVGPVTFEPDGAVDGVLQARRRELVRPLDEAQRGEGAAFIVVRIGDEQFGLEVALVREVTRLAGLTPLPCSPPQVAGVVNLRGDLLTVLDIRPALGITDSTPLNKLVVVTLGEAPFAILVEDLLDVVQLKASDLNAPPVASRGRAGDCCKGVVARGDRTLSLVDLRRVLASPTMQLGS